MVVDIIRETVDYKLLNSFHRQVRDSFTREELDIGSKIFIGLTGRSCSGKTYLSRALMDRRRDLFLPLPFDTTRRPRPDERRRMRVQPPELSHIKPATFEEIRRRAGYLLAYRRGRPDTARDQLRGIRVNRVRQAIHSGKLHLMVLTAPTVPIFRSYFPGTRVILVDPSPEDFRRMQEMRDLPPDDDSDTQNRWGFMYDGEFELSNVLVIRNPLGETEETLREIAMFLGVDLQGPG